MYVQPFLYTTYTPNTPLYTTINTLKHSPYTPYNNPLKQVLLDRLEKLLKMWTSKRLGLCKRTTLAVLSPWVFQEILYITAIVVFGLFVMQGTMDAKVQLTFLTLVPTIGSAFIKLINAMLRIMDAQQSLVGLRERLLVRINVQEKARILAIKPPIVKYGEADVDKDRGRGRTGSEEAAAAEAAAAGGKGKKGGKKGMKGEGTLRGTGQRFIDISV